VLAGSDNTISAPGPQTANGQSYAVTGYTSPVGSGGTTISANGVNGNIRLTRMNAGNPESKLGS